MAAFRHPHAPTGECRDITGLPGHLGIQTPAERLVTPSPCTQATYTGLALDFVPKRASCIHRAEW